MSPTAIHEVEPLRRLLWSLITPEVSAMTATYFRDSGVLRELLLRTARDDEAAFAEYYRLTSPFLRALVIRRDKSPDDVDEVLVALYVAIWRRAESYAHAPDGSVWAWTLALLDQPLAQLPDRNRVQ